MRYIRLLISLLLLLVPVIGCTPSSIPPTTPESTPSLEEEWVPDGMIKAGEYSGTASYGEFTISWRGDDKYIYVGITAKTNGWISMAVQPGSRMKGADMVFGFVKNEKAEIQDLYSEGNFGPHSPDKELGGTDDILSFGGKEEGEFTTVEFKRSLVTGDKYDIPITTGANKIIWAYGSSDDPAIKHSQRGYGEINL